MIESDVKNNWDDDDAEDQRMYNDEQKKMYKSMMDAYLILERLILHDGSKTSWHRGWFRKWYETKEIAEQAIRDSESKFITTHKITEHKIVKTIIYNINDEGS